MDFVYKIDTPLGTPPSDPKITVAQLTLGRLIGGFVFFPSGPAGTLHLVIRSSSHQIAPFNTGSDYALDDCVIPLHFGIDFFQPPVSLNFFTWNTSVSYEHTLTVSLFIEPLYRKKRVIDSIKNAFSGTKGYQKS